MKTNHINNSIKNPILPGFFPDPSIIRVGDDYYMVNSSFLYFPCIPISHSTDLVNWEVIGHAITDETYIDLSGYEPGRGFWAPDISYYNEKYYIIVTLRGNDDSKYTHRQMVVYSEKPEGPYSKPVFIDELGIDPSIFHDDDGKNYMLINTSVKIVPLSDDCLSATGPASVLFEGCTKIKTEGPHILKKDGYYYLLMAEGGTGDGHMITCARSKNLYGPYESCPHNPLLTQTDSKAYLQRTGHGKFFIGPDDEWYVVHLCSRKNGGKYSLLGRETAIEKVSWTNDGWPLINNGNGPKNEIQVSYPVLKKETLPYVIDFNKGYPIDTLTYGSYLFTRQTSINCDVSLQFTDSDANADEYGLIFYYDIFSYIKFGIKSGELAKKIFINVMNSTVSPEEQTLYESTIENVNSSLTLQIETKELCKAFYIDNGSERMLAKIIEDCSFLTDEGIPYGKRFTGPVVGVFGYKNNKKLSTFTMINRP